MEYRPFGQPAKSDYLSLSRFTLTPESEESVEFRMTQSKWCRLMQKLSGQRGRIFILFDTTEENTDDSDNSSSDSEDITQELGTEVSVTGWSNIKHADNSP